MNLIALDIATSTGYAVMRNGAITSGQKSFATYGGQPVNQLFCKWEEWINERMYKDQIDICRYELIDFKFKSPEWQQIYLGMKAIMMSAAHKRGIRTKGYTVLDVKLAATGKPKAGKPEMVAAAKAQWPDIDIYGDDQADALWVMFLAVNDLGDVKIKHHGELF